LRPVAQLRRHGALATPYELQVLPPFQFFDHTGNSRYRHKTGNFTDFGPSQALPSADSIHDLSGFAAFSRALRNGNLFAR
jgi:hypothetical protein